MKFPKGKFIGKLSVMIGIGSLIYFIVALAYRITFASFFGLVGVLLILFGLIKIFDNHDILMKKVPWLVYLFRVMFFSLLISFVILESFILYDGEKVDTGTADYIVILGAMVRGETPSLILSERLSTGLNYIKEHPNLKVILSGGQGPGEDISEAEAMRRYLIKNGIEGSRLIKEEKSSNTMENLKFTRNIIKETDSRDQFKLMIVTSDSHMFRAKFLAKRNGFKALGTPSNTIITLKPTYYIREYFGVIKSFIFDKG